MCISTSRRVQVVAVRGSSGRYWLHYVSGQFSVVQSSMLVCTFTFNADVSNLFCSLITWFCSFCQIGSRSSVYSSVSDVRKAGSFIYEEFMPTDGTDVKVKAIFVYLLTFFFETRRNDVTFLFDVAGVHRRPRLRTCWSEKITSAGWQGGTRQERQRSTVPSHFVSCWKTPCQEGVPCVQGNVSKSSVLSKRVQKLWHQHHLSTCALFCFNSKPFVASTCWEPTGDPTSVMWTVSVSWKLRRNIMTIVPKYSGTSCTHSRIVTVPFGHQILLDS